MTYRSRLAGLAARCLPHPVNLLSSSEHTRTTCRSVPPAVALLAVAIASMVTLPAFAVQRCEAGGKVSYSDLPCPGASTLSIDAAPPAAPDAAAADVARQRQAAELSRLQQLRELRERQDQRIRDLAARGAAARDKQCRTLAIQQKWREEDVRDASLKQAANARKRLRRAEERYREACR